MKRNASLARKGFTLVELLVVIGIIALLISILLPTLNKARESANRIKCGSNMRQIGQAMRQYAIDDVRGGAYPRTAYNVGLGFVRVGSALDGETLAGEGVGNVDADSFSVNFRPGTNDISAAMFHLLRESDLTPEVFICASDSSEAVEFSEGLQKDSYVNFADPVANTSYSWQNMYGDASAVQSGFQWTDSLGSSVAIGADMNPGITTDRDDVVSVTTDSSSKFMKLGNSNNHQKEGQSVLFADGSVRFSLTPFVGAGDDNIYTAQDINIVDDAGRIIPDQSGLLGADNDDETTQFTLSPVTKTDSYLLPTDDTLPAGEVTD